MVEDTSEAANASDEEAVLTTIVWLVTAILLLYPEVSIEVRSAVESSDVIVID